MKLKDNLWNEKQNKIFFADSGYSSGIVFPSFVLMSGSKGADRELTKIEIAELKMRIQMIGKSTEKEDVGYFISIKWKSVKGRSKRKSRKEEQKRMLDTLFPNTVKSGSLVSQMINKNLQQVINPIENTSFSFSDTSSH